MIELTVYNVSLRFLTPALIAVKQGSRGMLYEGFSDKIPGSTIRGSLMSWALREGLVTDAEITKEVSNPAHSLTPFLLSARSDGLLYNDVGIAHALSFKFKDGLGDERVYSLGVRDLVKELQSNLWDPVAALQTLIARTSVRIDEKGNDLMTSTNTERTLGAAITKDPGSPRNEWRLSRSSVKSGSYIGISIDRDSGSVTPGAFFIYEYIESGSIFTGVVTCVESSLMCKLLEEIRRSPAKILVGKGSSRGYGVAEIWVKEREINTQETRASGKRGCLAFEVIGPLLTLNAPHENSIPLPRPVEAGDELMMKLGTSVLSIKVQAVLGGVSEFGGWSLRRGSPKLRFNALSYGSIIVGEVEGDLRLLSLMPYKGLDELSSQGYNILLPLVDDFLPRFGEGGD